MSNIIPSPPSGGSGGGTADQLVSIVDNSIDLAADGVALEITAASGQSSDIVEINSHGGSGGDLVYIDSNGFINATGGLGAAGSGTANLLEDGSLSQTLGADVVAHHLKGHSGGTALLIEAQRGSDNLTVFSVANSNGTVISAGDVSCVVSRPNTLTFNLGGGLILFPKGANGFVGSDTIGGAGSVVVSNTNVGADYHVMLFSTGPTALPLSWDRASNVDGTSFKVIGTAGATFDYIIYYTY